MSREKQHPRYDRFSPAKLATAPSTLRQTKKANVNSQIGASI
jgi:hypothetical protein